MNESRRHGDEKQILEWVEMGKVYEETGISENDISKRLIRILAGVGEEGIVSEEPVILLADDMHYLT